MRTVKAVLLAAAMTLACGGISSTRAQDADIPVPDATVSMTGRLVAVGVGYGWGHGTLNYQGQGFTFCLRGLDVGDVGAVTINAQGVVFNLKSLKDFPGKYVAISTGAALIKGESGALLKNEHGVTMQLEAKEKGLRMNIAASGVRISLSGHHGCPDSTTARR